MRLLVTGSAGFIGSTFVTRWVNAHPTDQVVGYDALTYAGVQANLDPVRDRISFIHGDIGDRTAVSAALREHRVDTVVNFAAESHNSYAVVDPQRFVMTNVVGTQTLLDACRDVGVARVHHVSTCEVFGDLALDDPGAFTEDSPYRPRTPYNASKAGADHLVRAYHETFGMQTTISICSNNYGPRQFPEKVIPLFATRALRDEPLPVYASSDNRREWLHVDDHCRAIELILFRGRIGATYNIGSGTERSITHIADGVLDALGKPRSLKAVVPDRPGHDRRYLLDSSRIRAELGWAPEVAWERGLAGTARWYAEHPDWWQPLIGRSPVTESAWSGELA